MKLHNHKRSGHITYQSFGFTYGPISRWVLWLGPLGHIHIMGR